MRRTLALCLALAACETKTAPPPATADHYDATVFDTIERLDFNKLAAELALPLFWREDANKNKALDAAELEVVWGLPESKLDLWLAAGAFTEKFRGAYKAIAERAKAGPPLKDLSGPEQMRRAALIKELSQGRPTLVAWDFRTAPPADRAIVQHIMTAAETIETLYAAQSGVLALRGDVAKQDPESRAVFFRNQAPWCTAPATQNDAACNALPAKPEKLSGLYPVDAQKDKNFCEALQKQKGDLMSPFTVVKKGASGFEAVPYTVEYKSEMEKISNELKAAANAITTPDEAAFKKYLLAAAQAFLDNNWPPADEAWAAMNVANSKWYLRIAPDETYAEPCSQKANFHVSFARINPASVEWQKLLDPVKNDLEKALAALAGPPYQARTVAFHLPDFIDIILNAGDSRSPHGATIGQSLPNFGAVANEGRGRTVAMTNFYTDTDSRTTLRQLAESLLDKDSLAMASTDPKPQLMSTVLHEAAHNLGPAHQYKAKGKTDAQAFGGPLASMLEELKSQVAAAYFADWLAEKKLITDVQRQEAHASDVLWAFGHISRGMYDEGKKPKPYSQLAAIEIGFLVKEGAITFDANAMAANGIDKGAFKMTLAKFPAAFEKLMGIVAKVKAKGDKAGAEKLVKEFVDADAAKLMHAVIAERMLRAPRASFVYAVKY
ncbi:MAG: hypothetical protein IT381_02430 [Deltaproteobacteria bacterium]|nr:hypothetical protein [Deltaproteobacteria bacterium]